MAQLDISTIYALSKRYRANFINSLSGFKSVNLVGTKSNKGISNLTIVSSAVHVGAHPPLIGVLFRPESVPRHSLSNIKDTGYYTLNHVNSEIYRKAHQTSANYPEEVSEFDQCGFKELYQDGFLAPYVAQSIIRMGVELKEIKKLMNETEFIVGEIVTVCFPEEYQNEDGSIDIQACDTITVSGLDKYYKTSALEKLPYAKPEYPVTDEVKPFIRS